VVLRSLALLVCTLGWAGAWAVGLVVALPLGRGERWRAAVFGSWARASARVLGMRIEREGEIPEGPALLVSNHLSYVDIVLIASQLPCVFVSKSEVGSWPVLGRLARWMQTLFVDRTLRRDVHRVAQEIRGRLDRGQTVVFFPEGTSSEGAGVLDFHSSLLAPAAQEGWPVQYAAVHYVTPPDAPPAAETVCWWGDMDFGPHLLGLLAVPSFRARIAFGHEPVRDPDRKSLARRLHRQVASRFGSLLEDDPSCLIGA
jgi:1-acyl-sn-glycerol-3-phosphate acyltransferase